MIPLELSYIARAVGGTLVGGDRVATGIACDSRNVTPGSLFVALRGRRTDGHNHVAGAVAKGAVAALVERNGTYGCPYVLVESAVLAIGILAREHLARSSAKVVAVTGSMGKTSTKEMIAAALATRMTVFRSMGNLNTEIGLPMSVLRHTGEEVLVLEMAMRGIGQIAALAEIAPADVAVITNIGESHLEVLGSRGAIAAAKGELLSGMKNGGLAILNRDDDYFAFLSGLAQGPVVSFGYHKDSDYRISSVSQRSGGYYSCRVTTGADVFALQVPWPGLHNVGNAVAALATANALAISMEDAISGIEHCPPSPGRLRILSLPGDITLIDDTYNASPAATLSALATLAELPSLGRRIAVLGDMLELGVRANAAHREIGEKAAHVCDMVVTVGPLSRIVAEICASHNVPVHSFNDRNGVAELLRDELVSGDVILIKGSRSLQLEHVVTSLTGNGVGEA